MAGRRCCWCAIMPARPYPGACIILDYDHRNCRNTSAGPRCGGGDPTAGGAAGCTGGAVRLFPAGDRLQPCPRRSRLDSVTKRWLPIPGNQSLSDAEADWRLETFFWPYHHAITNTLAHSWRHGLAPAFVSIHSFTPRLNGGPPRPWHVGYCGIVTRAWPCRCSNTCGPGRAVRRR